MIVRELIEELERYDPEVPAVVRLSTGVAIIMDVGRRERNGVVQPQIYVDEEQHP